jgi:hypothetical protein
MTVWERKRGDKKEGERERKGGRERERERETSEVETVRRQAACQEVEWCCSYRGTSFIRNRPPP